MGTITAQQGMKEVRNYDATILAEADGLRSVAEPPDVLRQMHSVTVLSSPYGEYHLSAFSLYEIADDLTDLERSYEKGNEVVLVQKRSSTVVAFKLGSGE